MKYIILLGDGMADEKITGLGGKTPLQFAATPNMDLLARKGVMGTVKTVPEGFPPGSDVANLSVMGYNPRQYYTGRSPLEAASMGVVLGDEDVAFRCNLVTLSDKENYENKTMVDYSADEITTPEASVLVKEIKKHLESSELNFYAGFGFRHLLVWKSGPENIILTPPHDISGRVIGEHLPRGTGGEVLLNLMRESNKFLPDHPVNINRKKFDLRAGNSIWFWGQGKRPALPKFYDKFKIRGAVISAVDLIKGIGICAGLDVIRVEGVTGTIKTNFRGKAQAALEELKKGKDLVYLHLEAPDAAGHRGELDLKIKAIEEVDKVLGQLLNGLEQFRDYKIMLLPDHPTPLSIRTHTGNPVPFVVYNKRRECNNKNAIYDEIAASKSDLTFPEGHELMDYFILGRKPELK